MRIKPVVFFILLLYMCGACKTGQDLETTALNRVILNKSDTIYQFYTIKPTGRKPPVNESNYYYWFRADTVLVTRNGFDGKLLHGEYRSFYPNKNLKESGQFKYGLKTREWKNWFSNGELQSGSYAPGQGFELVGGATFTPYSKVPISINIEVAKNLMKEEAGAVLGVGLDYKEALILGIEGKLNYKVEQIQNNDVAGWLKR